MKGDNLRRLARLEAAAIPSERGRYVVQFDGNPDAPEVRAELAEAVRKGRRVALLPRKCASPEEWIARHAPENVRATHV